MRTVRIVTVELAVEADNDDAALLAAGSALDTVCSPKKPVLDYRIKGFADDPLPVVDVPDDYQEFDAWLGRDYDI